MYVCRTAIVISPTATLDERIRGLFPPGAMYRCEPEAMNTLVELGMRQMSGSIRAEPDWMEVLKNADAPADWAAEAKSRELTDTEFRYVLDELAYYSSLHSPGSKARLSEVDGVWLSDSLIDAETTNGLKEYAAILEGAPERQKDWHSVGESRVLNLIDPSLFPLIYSRSKLCRQPCTSPQAALNAGMPGEFPGLFDKWREALSGSDYYIPIMDDDYTSNYISEEFSWLPSEFRVDDNGAVTIESYINNLHPVKHAALYPIIASVFSKFVPLLEQVVTDLVHPRQPRVKRLDGEDYQCNGPESEPEDDSALRLEELGERLHEWGEHATFVRPQIEPFVSPERPTSPYKLCGRRLQAIVRMSSVELSLESPSYGGEDWSVAGSANERIITTGVFFYDVANIAQSSLQFREAVHDCAFDVSQYDIVMLHKVYGIYASSVMDEVNFSQEIGDINIKDGRCVVFPSTLQHKMPKLKLADTTKPGHCKMLTFYFVDPSTRIPSTEIVPPQQQEWYFEDVVASEPFRSLPHLVVEGIMDKVDFPISLKEAKTLRMAMAAESDKDRESASTELFEPHYSFE